eukprot:1555818-Pyramimonas_sp.AAC.1
MPFSLRGKDRVRFPSRGTADEEACHALGAVGSTKHEMRRGGREARRTCWRPVASRAHGRATR